VTIVAVIVNAQTGTTTRNPCSKSEANVEPTTTSQTNQHKNTKSPPQTKQNKKQANNEYIFVLSAAWVSGQFVHQSASENEKRHYGHSSLMLQQANYKCSVGRHKQKGNQHPTSQKGRMEEEGHQVRPWTGD